MKKPFLFLAIMLMALVTGCKKEAPPETKMVEGIELPPLTEQFAEGSPITVKGSGFTQADQIAFRTPTKASSDVEAKITDAKLYGFGWPDNDNPDDENCTVYQIDRTTGVPTVLHTLADGQDVSSSVVIGHVAYGINYPKNIGSFNFDTKTYKDLGEVANRECLGVIDGKLHVITANQGSISLSQVNPETGIPNLTRTIGWESSLNCF